MMVIGDEYIGMGAALSLPLRPDFRKCRRYVRRYTDTELKKRQ